MENEKREAVVARRSPRIYLSFRSARRLCFFVASGRTGDPGLVPRVGGAFSVGLLTLIVSMPLVTARMKARARSGG